jgi:hypothetical protein
LFVADQPVDPKVDHFDLQIITAGALPATRINVAGQGMRQELGSASSFN